VPTSFEAEHQAKDHNRLILCDVAGIFDEIGLM
jgi:hypothetical protein